MAVEYRWRSWCIMFHSISPYLNVISSKRADDARPRNSFSHDSSGPPVMGGNPRGDGGGRVPPTILKVGDTISNVPPPPHVFVVGRFFVEKIGFLTNLLTFFFLLVRMSDLDRRVPLICRKKLSTQMALRKKCRSPPPPPPHEKYI